MYHQSNFVKYVSCATSAPLDMAYPDLAEDSHRLCREKQYFLVVVDSHSKWLEVIFTTAMTAARTIEALRTLFARFGLPEEVVSDNATTFKSEDVETFLKQNGVKQILTPPYHPASNGAAERSVQSLKCMLFHSIEDVNKSSMSLSHNIADWLYVYRKTPHTTTNRTPAELLLSPGLGLVKQ